MYCNYYFSNKLGRRAASERGGGALIATGAILILVLFTTFAVNASRYYGFKTDLTTYANQIASYAGTRLPNYKLAYDAADAMFKTFKQDIIFGNDRFPSDIAMKMYVNYINSTTGVLSTAEYPGQASQIKLPIKSLTIKLEGTFNFKFLDLTGTTAGGAGLKVVRAVATTQLAPTDVVLVIENSNSVVSPADAGGADVTPILTESDDSTVGLVPANYGSPYDSPDNPLAKSDIRTMQCFGKVTLNMKKAALVLFDLLSSSATYRVGVVHTLQYSGQYPTETVRIMPDSYAKVYKRHALADLPVSTVIMAPAAPMNNLFDWPLPNLQYGTYEYPESRCAVLTDITNFKIPNHPLKTALDATYYSGIFRSADTMKTLLVNEGVRAPGVTHLAYDTAEGLLPRELIWAKNAGETFENGRPNPKYDYTHTQFGILRAIDMLRTAPKRTDNLPVQRQIVLVLTDGFEATYTTQTGHNLSMDDLAFGRIDLVSKTDTTFNPISSSYAYPSTPTRINEYYCNSGASNPIPGLSNISTTSIALNNAGIKLGVLYYGIRSDFTTTNQFAYLQYLPGHDPSDVTRLPTYRSECNTQWVMNKGRFFIEAASDTGGYGVYREQMAPQVLRSVFISELLNENLPTS